MRALLRFFSWRHGRRRPMRVLLGALAIALGVALFVSVDIANNTVIRSFERTIDDLAGKAELQVTRAGGMGVDEAALEKIHAIAGAIAAPIVQRSITLPDLKEGTILVLGVDFWKDSPLRMYKFTGAPSDVKAFVAAAFRPDAIVVTKRFADRHGLRVGAKLTAETPRGRATLVVGGLLEHEGPARALSGNFAVMEIHAAQRLFGLKGRYDRIELAGVPREQAAAALGPAYTVGPIARRSPVVEDALARIRSMIAISAIALVVGLFIIYNSVSISVVERVREIGILRSIGAGRRQILGAILLEWATVGLAGSIAGIGLGWALARGLVQFTARTVNMFVLAVDVRGVLFSWTGAGVAVAAGTLVATAAALLPGIDAMRITPLELLRQGTYQYRATPRYRRSFLAGLALIAVSAVLLFTVPMRLPTFGLLAVSTVAFFAIALCGPQFTIWLARATRPLLRRCFRIEGYLAADNVSKFPQRTALTVVAFGGAVAMMVSSASLVRSFQLSSEHWMAEAFPFDLSIGATDLTSALYSTVAHNEEVVDVVRHTPGVEQAYGVKSAFVPFGGSEIMIISVDVEPFFQMHRARGRDNRVKWFDTPELRAQLAAGEKLLVSENLVWLAGVRPGDAIELPTPRGPRRFVIEASIEDYSWPTGAIVMDRGAYKRIWEDDTVTYVDIRVVPGVPVADVKSALAAEVGKRGTFFIFEVTDLQRIGRDAIEQSMALANLQVLIAMVIGFLGIVNTLLISVLRRTREIGLLRAVGTTRAQVWRGVVIEAVFIAIVGGLFGVGAGLVGAAVPLRLFTLKLSGFWVPFAVPLPTIALAMAGSLVLGFVASLVPARRAAGLNVLEAVAYE